MAWVFGRDGSGTRQRHPERLNDRGHGIGGKHPRTASCAGAGRTLQSPELGFRDLSLGKFSDRFKNILNIDIVPFEFSGIDRPAVDKDRREVQADGSHEGPGEVFIAAGDRDETVKPLSQRYAFDRISDDFPGNEGGLHPLGPHRNAVRNGDGPEFKGDPARFPDSGLDLDGDLVEVNVTGSDVGGGIGNADKRTVEIFIGQSHRPKHGPGRGPFGAFGDVLGAVFEFWVHG